MRAAAALLALALVARLVAVAAGQFTPIGDPADYLFHARAILDTGGYPESPFAGGGPTAMRPPVYPYLLAAVLWLGDDVAVARLLNAVIGTLAAGLVGLVAFQLWGRRIGLAALGLAAVYPPLILAGNAPLSEPLFVALELAAVAVLLHARGRRHPVRWLALAGALTGLAVLTRPNGFALLVPFTLAAWWLARGATRRHAVMYPAVLVAAALLVVVPWTVRNAVATGHFVAVTTSGGYGVAGTYNETARDDPRFPGAWRPATLDPAMRAVVERGAALDEVQLGRALGERGWADLFDHPAYVAQVAWHNLRRWAHVGPHSREFAHASALSEGLSARQADIGILGFWLVVPLAVAGVALGALRGTPPWLWLVPLAMLGSVAFLMSAVRFRVPVDPFLVLLAAHPVATVAAGVLRRGGPGFAWRARTGPSTAPARSA